MEEQPKYHISEEEMLIREVYQEGSPIGKYSALVLSDFTEESFVRLPADANILDPRLMGPNFMNGRLRLPLPPAALGRGERGGVAENDMHGLMDIAAGLRLEEADRAHWRRRPRSRHLRLVQGLRGNLDPEAPLAQLLWQSLLPWNVFPTPSNPPPPPPAWL